MKAIIALIVVLGIVSTYANIEQAVVRMKGTTVDPTITGLIYFTTIDANTINMTVSLSGITKNLGGTHGIHIHQYGDITEATGNSVGVHWNIYNQDHGCPPNASRHLGDTGNWDVALDGTISQTKTLDRITLKGADSLIGLGVIFHNFTDDCNNTLSSGQRLAQGVIGIAKTNGSASEQNTALPPPAYGGGNTFTSAVCIVAPSGPTSQNVNGWVRFDQATAAGPTTVTAMITGFTKDSIHGLHIHQWGDMSALDSTSAGPHYTGVTYDATQTHSIPTSGLAKHVGDLGNIYHYDANGVAYFKGTFDNFGLYGSTNNIIGRAIIVHANPDDCTQPYGNAGARSGVCVIGPANPTLLAAKVIPTDVPTAQDVNACPLVTTSIYTSFGSMLIPSVVSSLVAIFLAYF
jgi:Cu-Zn family superoxide dismutase